MRTFTFFGCAAAATLIACGGRTDDVHSGLEGPTVEPNDVAYPSGDQGYDVGNVIPNVAFLGYEHLDPTTEIDTKAEDIGRVRFSDFYDPTGERGLTYLYVSLQYVWCGPSNEQDDFTNGANWTGANPGYNYASQYASAGVRFVTLLADGPTYYVDATVNDLMLWVDHHKARVSEAILPHDELALNILGAVAPYNVIVDLRTMRVVDVEVGFDTRMAHLANLVAAHPRVRGVADH